jgi:glucosamine kinase
LTRPGTKVLGLDVGGTTSRARLVAGGNIVADARSSSANAAAVGLDVTAHVLDELLGQLPLEDWAPLDAACAGIAGALSGSVRLFQQRLGAVAKNVVVLGDVHLVLPAAGLERGIALICGTGSAALATDGHQTVTAGGWGYLLGDEAGGYWTVREAVRELLQRSDRGRPLGPLGPALLRAAGVLDVTELRDRFYEAHRPSLWAALAPVVLGSADAAVEVLLENAGKALEGLVEAVEERLGGLRGLPIVVAGGLTAHPRFSQRVTAHLRRARPNAAVSVLDNPPVVGAVRLAEHAARRTPDEVATNKRRADVTPSNPEEVSGCA